MKKVNVTFSIPVEVNELLHTLVGRKKLSAFVSSTLQKALEDKANALKKAYAMAEKDPDRLKTINEWQALDVEGWE